MYAFVVGGVCGICHRCLRLVHTTTNHCPPCDTRTCCEIDNTRFDTTETYTSTTLAQTQPNRLHRQHSLRHNRTVYIDNTRSDTTEPYASTTLAQTQPNRMHRQHNAFTCFTVGVLLHVRTCKGRSQISRTAEPIASQFGTAMGTGSYGGAQKSVGTYFARAHVYGDGSRSQERLERLRSNLVHG